MPHVFQAGDRVRVADTERNRIEHPHQIGHFGTVQENQNHEFVNVVMDDDEIPPGGGRAAFAERYELVPETQETHDTEQTQLYIIELQYAHEPWVETWWRHDGEGRGNWHPLTLEQAQVALGRAQHFSPNVSFRIATYPEHQPLPPTPVETFYRIQRWQISTQVWADTYWRPDTHTGQVGGLPNLTHAEAVETLAKAWGEYPNTTYRIHEVNTPDLTGLDAILTAVNTAQVPETDTDTDTDDEAVTGQCCLCEDDVTASTANQFTESGDRSTGNHTVCNSCASSNYVCYNCSTITDESFTVEGYSRDYCSVCIDRRATQCESCELWYLSTEIYNYRCNNCASCECDERDCSDCYPDGYSGLKSYSYKPTPIFHNDDTGTSNRPHVNTPYYGMELEIGIDIDEINSAVSVLTDAAPHLIYCKEDGSVNGLEMVTHPMTLEGAKQLIPFAALRVLRNEYDASAYPHGIHIHVSRSGFTNDVHVYRWMKLFYRNPDDVKRIARRDSAEWASFSDNERINQKYTAEKVKGKRSRKQGVHTRRYSAINVENTETFEVRVFRGSLRRDEILASIELVAASVEYARQLTTADIMRNDGWSWQAFISWADAQGDTYRELIDLDSKTQITAKRERIEAKAQEAKRLVAQTRYDVQRIEREIDDRQVRIEAMQLTVREYRESLAERQACLEQVTTAAQEITQQTQAELAEFVATYGNVSTEEMAEV